MAEWFVRCTTELAIRVRSRVAAGLPTGYSAGSREEDFLRVFTVYGRGGHLGRVTWMPRTNFRSPTQEGST